MNEKDLINNYRNGDQTAFEEFYRITKDSLYTFLYNRSHKDADDLFQETFIRFINAVNAREITNPRSYLFKIALNLLRNTSRERKTVSLSENYDLPDEISDTDDYPVKDEDLQRSLKTLADEKPSFYEVMHLHLFEGMTFDNIAEILRKNRNTISSQYRYAIHYLKNYLKSVEKPEIVEVI